MRGIIYCYTAPNGKSYIGQTVDEEKRKYQHKCNAFCKGGRDWNKPFYRAIRKYGWDSFVYEILWEKESEDIETLRTLLNKQEIFYISVLDTFKNGYNSTVGGTSVIINSVVGHKLSKEHLFKLKQSVSKAIWQFDLDGNFIKEYQSAAEAARVLNKNCSSTIIACCRGKAFSSNGFQWKYAGEYPGKFVAPKKKHKGVSGKNNSRSKKVLQFDLNSNLIKEWDCLMDISREFNYNSGTICNAIKKKQKYKNFYWKYNN